MWATVALVALVLRPTGVLISTANSELPLGERLYVAWIGPRGIIAAAGAALSAIKLRRHGLDDGAALEALVFATIAITVAVQGLSAGVAAKLLRVHAVRAPGLAIAGANFLALAVARCLKTVNIPVRLLDTNAARCAEARVLGLDALQGSASDAEDIGELCEERGRFLAVVVDVAVAVVLDHRNVVLAGKLNQLQPALARHHSAGRIVGVADEDRLGLGRQPGRNGLGGDLDDF